jgi:predicted oxidoreductase
VLTRKTLGGLETDLSGRSCASTASRCPACSPPVRRPGSAVAACTGYRSLEGTFLGGCMFSGRAAGRTVAAQG